MDPVIALYTVLLAVALGLSGFVRGDARRRGRGLLLAATLAGFMLVAATSALVNVTSVAGMILTALAVLFAAQSATTAFALLWREICCAPPARTHPISPNLQHPHGAEQTATPSSSPNATETAMRP
jgi:hypothetical protein